MTDSQSMLRKIEAGKFVPEWIDLIRNSHLKKLIWIFTPGHAGVKGNERADKLAGEAPIGGHLQMGETEVLNAMKENLDEETSSSKERLLEMGKKGATLARNIGKARRDAG